MKGPLGIGIIVYYLPPFTSPQLFQAIRPVFPFLYGLVCVENMSVDGGRSYNSTITTNQFHIHLNQSQKDLLYVIITTKKRPFHYLQHSSFFSLCSDSHTWLGNQRIEGRFDFENACFKRWNLETRYSPPWMMPSTLDQLNGLVGPEFKFIDTLWKKKKMEAKPA